MTIPANTTATVLIPARAIDAVAESGKPLAQGGSVKLLRLAGGRAVLEVAPGRYNFESRVP